MNSIQAVQFDCDGVLGDSEKLYFPILRESFHILGKELGRTLNLSEELFIQLYVVEHTHTRGLLEHFGLSGDLVNRVREIRKPLVPKYFEQLEQMPYALEVVAQLAKTYPISVVSSSIRHDLDYKMEKLGFTDLVTATVAGDEVKRRKPHPEPYIRGAELLGVKPENTIVVEDTKEGMSAGLAAGCRVIGYPNGCSCDANVKGVHIIRDLREIPRIITRLTS